MFQSYFSSFGLQFNVVDSSTMGEETGEWIIKVQSRPQQSAKAHDNMTRLHLRTRISRWLEKGNRRSGARQAHRLEPASIEYSSIPRNTGDCLSQDHLFHMTRAVGGLRSDLAYFQELCDNILIPSIPLIQWHCDEILSSARDCSNLIAEAHDAWKGVAFPNDILCGSNERV